jgi:hypothetical protein
MTSTEVARSVSIAGKATLTMEPSILAMPDPRIVASNTHGLALGAQTPEDGTDRIAASSHGPGVGLIMPPCHTKRNMYPVTGFGFARLRTRLAFGTKIRRARKKRLPQKP